MRAAPDEIEHGVEEDDGRAADAVHESVAELGGDETPWTGRIMEQGMGLPGEPAA